MNDWCFDKVSITGDFSTCGKVKDVIFLSDRIEIVNENCQISISWTAEWSGYGSDAYFQELSISPLSGLIGKTITNITNTNKTELNNFLKLTGETDISNLSDIDDENWWTSLYIIKTKNKKFYFIMNATSEYYGAWVDIEIKNDIKEHFKSKCAKVILVTGFWKNKLFKTI